MIIYGGPYHGESGAYWHSLTDQSIEVRRRCDNVSVEWIRVRIWKYD